MNNQACASEGASELHAAPAPLEKWLQAGFPSLLQLLSLASPDRRSSVDLLPSLQHPFTGHGGPHTPVYKPAPASA